MPSELFEINCPCCQTILKVDGKLRAVIAHTEPVKKAPIEDLTAAVQKLKGEAGRRDEVFRKSFEAEKKQSEVLNRKFDELFKQASEDPEFGKRNRDIDMD